MKDNFTVRRTTTSVDVFFVPNTEENRTLARAGKFQELTQDKDGYYKNLAYCDAGETWFDHNLED